MVLVLNKGAGKKEIDEINRKLSEMPARKTLDAKKFCGVIRLNEDPLTTQKWLRDEWE